MSRQSGFALLIVLWSVVLLSLLATQITAAGRSDLQLAGNLREAAEAEAAADAGVFTAIYRVLDPATRWAADDSPHVEDFGRFRLTIRVLDEDGKVNPNLVPPDLMAALLMAGGADAATARAIAIAIGEWRFPGNAAQKLQRYRAAGRQAGPTGQPFRSVGELGLVLGMTPALLTAVSPHMSVYADGSLEYAHADPALQAIIRGLTGAAPPPPAIPPPPTAATITATAVDAKGGRFTRRATVAFGRDRAGHLFRILAWQAA